MKYDAVNISLICLIIICLVMLLKTLHEKRRGLNTLSKIVGHYQIN